MCQQKLSTFLWGRNEREDVLPRQRELFSPSEINLVVIMLILNITRFLNVFNIFFRVNFFFSRALRIKYRAFNFIIVNTFILLCTFYFRVKSFIFA